MRNWQNEEANSGESNRTFRYLSDDQSRPGSESDERFHGRSGPNNSHLVQRSESNINIGTPSDNNQNIPFTTLSLFPHEPYNPSSSSSSVIGFNSSGFVLMQQSSSIDRTEGTRRMPLPLKRRSDEETSNTTAQADDARALRRRVGDTTLDANAPPSGNSISPRHRNEPSASSSASSDPVIGGGIIQATSSTSTFNDNDDIVGTSIRPHHQTPWESHREILTTHARGTMLFLVALQHIAGLSEEHIESRIGRETYKSFNDEGTQRDEMCCICQEDYVHEEELGILDCGHQYHLGCIKQWLVLKNKCPICKQTALADADS
ncbi:hypothetical protein RJT34_05742 [Clitoria ternatea]|uniref:RING-type E3 ubiquitin transferase n=1 Tax=Clitoria ternatea TaxID=43366 RepID=A0AAN9K2L3_CLITE